VGQASHFELRGTAKGWILPDGALLRYSLGRPQIQRRMRVENTIEDQWSIKNAAPSVARFEADITVDAEFRDLFELRETSARRSETAGSPAQTTCNRPARKLAPSRPRALDDEAAARLLTGRV
jgi:hypothetical protein